MNVLVRNSDFPDAPGFVVANNAVVNTVVVLISFATWFRMFFSWWLIWQFWKRNPLYSTAFFQLYVIQGIPDWILVWQRLIQFYCQYDKYWFFSMYQILVYHSDVTVRFLDTILMINRLTAIVFWRWHARLWSGWTILLVAIGMELYPFLLVAPLLSSFECVFITQRDSSTSCRFQNQVKHSISFISNIFHSVFPLVLGTIVFILQRRFRTTPATRKREIRLFYACVVCDFWLILSVSLNYTLQVLFPYKFDSLFMAKIFLVAMALSCVAWILYVYSFLILCLCVNSNLRTLLCRYFGGGERQHQAPQWGPAGSSVAARKPGTKAGGPLAAVYTKAAVAMRLTSDWRH